MLDTTLQQLFVPVVTALGYELVGVERIKKIVRVYIDSPEGIKISDCERVSHQIEGILAVEDSIRGQYTLEVSSPGMDRPLFTLAQFTQFVGQKVKLRLTQPVNAQRTLVGILQQVEDHIITLVIEGVEYKLPYDQIQRAHIVPDF
jgi:ribosome maturation factor RimP